MARAKGEGQITKLKSGKWRARRERQGKVVATTRDTRIEAVEALDELNKKLDRLLTASGWTVPDWVSHWIDADADRAAETYRLYRRTLVKHLTPAFAGVQLEDLDTPTVQLEWDRLLAAGVGTATIGRCHSLLHTALGEAARRGLVPHVATDHARPPKHRPSKPAPINPAEARAVLEVCQSGCPSGRIIGAILLTGLRVSEAIGLTWADIDPDGWMTVHGTKTEASAARLPLVGAAAGLVGEQGAALDEWPVFPSSKGLDVPTSRQTVHRHWRELQVALGITPARRVHDLRHSTGSLLASAGVPTRTIQSVLRHTSAAMSVHYSRPYDDDLAAALTQLGNTLTRV